MALLAAHAVAQSVSPAPSGHDSGHAAGLVPLLFVENRGQWPTDAAFVARHRGFAARFHRDGIMLQRERHGDSPLGVAVKLVFEGSSLADSAPVGEQWMTGRVHSFVGATTAWQSDLRACSVLRYPELWPGVDLVVHDRGGQLEYDLVLAPTADLANVRLRAEGADSLRLDADGSLIAATGLGDLRQLAPSTFERDAAGELHAVPSRFTLAADGSFGFAVERSDASRELIVDPVVLWASYFGATGDDLPQSLAVDAVGDVYVGGYTSSLFTFPVTGGSYQPALGGGLYDGFVAKLDPDLGGNAQLVWCTFLGGSANDNVQRIALRPAGDLAVIGATFSTDFPTTPGALQSTKGVGRDSFVAVLSGNGAALTYSTFFGAGGDDNLFALAVEPDGKIDAAGYTTGAGLPTSAGAFQASYAGGAYDAWVGRFDPTQTGAAQLAYGTYFGNTGENVLYDLAISAAVPGRLTLCGYSDSPGGAIAGTNSGSLGGFDVMVVQLDPALTGSAQRRFSHFLGGTAGNDYGYGLDVEANGDVVVAGQTGGGFPVTLGSYRTSSVNVADGFVTKLTADGASIRYSTYVGLSSTGLSFSYVPMNVHVAATGVVTVAGYTSWHVPMTSGAIDSTRGGSYESFVTRFSAPLTEALYSTYIGGGGDDVMLNQSAHVDGDVVTVCYYTTSAGLPVQNPFRAAHQGGTYDGHLLRFDMFANPSGGAGQANYVTSTHAVGTSPRGVVVHDVDQDGDRDIVTANAGSHDLTLLRNQGAGVFAAPATIALGGNQGPQAVVAGDFDGDGDGDDLAVACAESNAIAIVANAGGAPTVTTQASAGYRPVHLAAGSFNGNATTDLVIAREGNLIAGGAGLEISLDGGAPVSLTPPPGRPTHVTRVAVGDLDGDGDLDFAAVAHAATDEVQLWTNNGSGAFAFAGFLPMTSSLALGAGLCLDDLDQDNDVDIGVAQPLLIPTPSQTLRVWRYTGSGALDAGDYTQAPNIASTGVVASALAAADLDQDYTPGFGGGVDFVVVNGGSGTVDVHYGFSGTTQAFGAVGPVATGSGPIDVGLGDVENNGTIDIVIVNRTANSVTVHRTDGALARPFGTGCAGTGGLVPVIGALGLPRLGQTMFVQVTQARALSPAILAFSVAPGSVVLGGGCTLLMGSPVSTLLLVTDGSGQASFPQFIPNLPALLGFDAYFQWAILDPAGAYANLLAFSNALRIQVGG